MPTCGNGRLNQTYLANILQTTIPLHRGTSCESPLPNLPTHEIMIYNRPWASLSISSQNRFKQQHEICNTKTQPIAPWILSTAPSPRCPKDRQVRWCMIISHHIPSLSHSSFILSPRWSVSHLHCLTLKSPNNLRLSTSHQTGTKKLDQLIQTSTTWSKQVLLLKVEPVDVKVDVSPWNIEYSPMAMLLGWSDSILCSYHGMVEMVVDLWKELLLRLWQR